MAAQVSAAVDESTVSVPLGDADDVEFRGGNLHLGRERPFGASLRSTTSSKSVVLQNPNTITSEYTANNLFSFRVSWPHSTQPLSVILLLQLNGAGEFHHNPNPNPNPWALIVIGW